MSDPIIAGIRRYLTEQNLQALVIPSSDPHMSEYLPDHWKLREAVSGFTGSAGNLLVSQDRAGLWTDSRYFIQAESQLNGTGIDLYRMGLPDTPTLWKELITWCPTGSRAGFFGALHSFQEIRSILPVLDAAGIDPVPLETGVIDSLWPGRPGLPVEPAFEHREQFAGQSVTEKLEHLRQFMETEKADVHVVSLLDDIAWLMNIRGSDIEFNPLVVACALVFTDSARLYVHDGKIPPDLAAKLEGSGVTLAGYDQFLPDLSKLPTGSRVWVDADNASWAIMNRLDGRNILEKTSPIALFKAIKNTAELSGMRQSHIRDGVAMVRFLQWMEREVPSGTVTEISALNQLEKFRKDGDHHVGPSFGTISSYGAHGAIVHYAPTPESDIPIGTDSLYLVDSGAQYLDGTTDITRTLHFGQPTPLQREHFTRVLAGHLQLAATSFPQGTTGKQLDTIARMPLWEAGLQYGHGTGHGIGAFLCVHEGPHAISYYRCKGVALLPGMVTSNEPGLYLEGEYGIRVENVLAVVPDEEKTGQGLSFYKFVPLTMCPIDRRLVDTELLSPLQLRTLNEYHQLVRNTLTPLLEPETAAWLERATAPF